MNLGQPTVGTQLVILPEGPIAERAVTLQIHDVQPDSVGSLTGTVDTDDAVLLAAVIAAASETVYGPAAPGEIHHAATLADTAANTRKISGKPPVNIGHQIILTDRKTNSQVIIGPAEGAVIIGLREGVSFEDWVGDTMNPNQMFLVVPLSFDGVQRAIQTLIYSIVAPRPPGTNNPK